MMRKSCSLLFFLMAFVALAIPVVTHAQVAVGISVHIGPPPLRVYAQPVCPGPDYIWTPGYWAYGDAGYYWVPGAWVIAPHPGLLWTPGYWGFGGGVYAWHPGYWGPHVGFYGGINYGFGYGGVGFGGGEWRGGHFFYNTAITHVNVTIVHNTYVNRTVIVRNNSHVAFNGEGGVRAVPNREEMAAERDHHFEATHEQADHEHTAMARPENFNRRDAQARNNEMRRNDNRQDRDANRGAENRQNRNVQRQMNHRQQHNNQHNRPEKAQKDERRPHGERPRF